MWKQLVYQGIEYQNYEISTHGVIRNKNKYELKRKVENHNNRKTQYFYSTISQGKRHTSKRVALHRAVAETFIPNPNNYRFVIFKDDDYQNISIDNLLWTNHLSNYNENKKKKTNSKSVSRRRRKVKEMAVEYKGGCCVACGYNKCISALDFHHLDPNEKDFAISKNGLTRSWESTKKELDKCICVCANCHREIHAGLINVQNLAL